MTKKIYCYMKIHQIDIQKVSKETGIDRKIFQKQLGSAVKRYGTL